MVTVGSRCRWLVMALGVLLATSVAAQQNPKVLVSTMVHNELHSSQGSHYWVYLDSKVEHGKTEVDRVLETKQCWFRWPVSVDGHAPSAEERAQAKQHIEQLADDASVRQKNRDEISQDAHKAESLLKILPDAFVFTEVGHNDGSIVLKFRPNPSFDPPSREARVFHAMAGELVIDAKDERLQKLSGTLTHNVDFGWGILGKIRQGGTFMVRQSEVTPGDWELTKLDVNITGRALFFHTISEQQHERMMDFQPVPAGISLKQAAQLVQRPDRAQNAVASAQRHR
jgi:hypothetical protein